MAEIQLPEGGSMLPSNSYKDKVTTMPPKEVKSVIKGKAKKKSSFSELFLSEDRGMVGEYVLKEVIIPMLKDTIFSAATSALSITLFGDSHHLKNNNIVRSGLTSKIAYNSFSNGGGTKASNVPAIAPSKGNLDVSGIIFDDKGDAETVLGSLAGLVIDYGQVTVADFYALAELDYDYTMHKWGWYKDAVMAAKVCPTRGGWYIEISKAGSLN